MLPSAVFKIPNFLMSLFFTNLTSRIFLVLLFLMHAHTRLFCNDFLASKNFIKSHVNNHHSQLIYDANFFDNNFNFLNMFLTNFNSSAEF